MSVEKAKQYASMRHRKSIFHVDIEEVDESWALKLLNECELEDSPITVHKRADNHPFRPKDIGLINESGHSAPNDPFPDFDSIILVEEPETHETSSPSAIERQIQAMAKARRKPVDENPDSRNSSRSRLSIAQLKAWFVS